MREDLLAESYAERRRAGPLLVLFEDLPERRDLGVDESWQGENVFLAPEQIALVAGEFALTLETDTGGSFEVAAGDEAVDLDRDGFEASQDLVGFAVDKEIDTVLESTWPGMATAVA
ncbi:hypothetical protein HYQ46_009619 [Verticillium longisporum]|nr:hypothetical protein HYQ46_009619 [Verticillium longisporum]